MLNSPKQTALVVMLGWGGGERVGAHIEKFPAKVRRLTHHFKAVFKQSLSQKYCLYVYLKRVSTGKHILLLPFIAQPGKVKRLLKTHIINRCTLKKFTISSISYILQIFELVKLRETNKPKSPKSLMAT